jgi:CheY-like chemotaxis protein
VVESHGKATGIDERRLMNILVADDEIALTEQLRIFLESRGHTVTTANDGGTALRLIEAGGFDMVFLDESMPELTGLEIAKYLRQHGRKEKCVLVTGYPCLDDDFAKTIGADEFVSKPAELKDIERIVNKYGKQSGQ